MSSSGQTLGKLLVICAPTSSGKSLLSSLLCKSSLNFIKLNTKAVDLQTRLEVSKTYFQKELEEASLIFGIKLQTAMELFTLCENENNPALERICERIRRIEASLPVDYCYDYLYANYFRAVLDIVENGKNCVLDHNFFLDPYPFRKNHFFRHFAPIKHNTRILQLYNLPENTLLNLVKRNEKFQSFISASQGGFEAEKSVLNESVLKGYSAINFRQPLRLLENWASMYAINQEESPVEGVLDKLSVRTLFQLVEIAKYQQEKLVGLIFAYSYPAPHIASSREHFFQDALELLNTLEVDGSVYIRDKKFEYDYFILIDNDLLQKSKRAKIFKLLEEWPLGPVELYSLTQIEKSSRNRKVDSLLQEIKKNQRYTLCKWVSENFDRDDFRNKVFFIESMDKWLSVEHIILKTLSELEKGVTKVTIVFPIDEENYSCIELQIDEKNTLLVELSSSSKKSLNHHANNLVMLGKLLSRVAQWRSTCIKAWKFSRIPTNLNQCGFNL